MKNEFGEEFTQDEVEKLTEQIRELSSRGIDDFWHDCGWIDSEHGSNKSLPDWRIKRIKSEHSFASQSVHNLLLEARKEDVHACLEKIKKATE